MLRRARHDVAAVGRRERRVLPPRLARFDPAGHGVRIHRYWRARCDGFCSGVQVWQALAGLAVLMYRGSWRTDAVRRNVNGGSRRGLVLLRFSNKDSKF